MIFGIRFHIFIKFRAVFLSSGSPNVVCVVDNEAWNVMHIERRWMGKDILTCIGVSQLSKYCYVFFASLFRLNLILSPSTAPRVSLSYRFLLTTVVHFLILFAVHVFVWADKEDQELAIQYFEALAQSSPNGEVGKTLKLTLDFAKKHKVVIDKFGRYPHRNAILDRESTPEEVEYLSQPGSGF